MLAAIRRHLLALAAMDPVTAAGIYAPGSLEWAIYAIARSCAPKKKGGVS